MNLIIIKRLIEDKGVVYHSQDSSGYLVKCGHITSLWKE